jgi:hypothetical protein
MATRQVYLWSASGAVAGVTLPVNFALDDGDLNFRSKIDELAFGDGGREMGDGRVQSRTVTITGSLFGADTLRAQDQALIGPIFRLGEASDLRVHVIDSEDPSDLRYMNLGRLKSIKTNFAEGLEGRYSKVDFKFTALDPYWYVAAGTTNAVASGLTVSFTGLNNAGAAECYPVVRIESVSGSIQNFTFDNQTNLDSFTISVATSAAGYVEVDGVNGSVDQSETDWIRYFTGVFPRLSPGSNNLQLLFVSAPPANTTVTVSWTTRELTGP